MEQNRKFWLCVTTNILETFKEGISQRREYEGKKNLLFSIIKETCQERKTEIPENVKETTLKGSPFATNGLRIRIAKTMPGI